MPDNTAPHSSEGSNSENEQNVAERWDPEGLRKRIYNNEDLFAALLNSFLTDSPKNAENLLSSAKNLDFGKLKEVSHLLKGVCGQLCADNLHKICVEIEQVSLTPIEDVDKQHLENLCSAFTSELEAVEQLFRDALSTPSQDETSTGPETLDKGSFLAEIKLLQERLERSEYIDPDSLSELKTAYGENTEMQKLVIRLIEEINLFDNDAASTTLKEIISKA